MRRSRASVLSTLGVLGVCVAGLVGCADGADSGRTASGASAGAMGSPMGQNRGSGAPGSSQSQPGATSATNNTATNTANTQTTTPSDARGDSKEANGMTTNGNESGTTQTAMFGAGCFWGVQAKFDKINGVIATEVGYAGGQVEKPTYKQVCTDETGHAEVVHITYDPAKVSYQQLVNAFFALHDPTQLNRQGPDYGTQYRTLIFYYSPDQQKTAQETIQRLTDAKKFARPIVTQVVPAPEFWKAEEYHQKYLFKRGLDECHL